MKQYIDKAALVAEIEKRKKETESNCGGYKSYDEHRCDSCIVGFYEEFLEILDTLEVKEVDLKKKKEVIVKGFVAVDNGGDKMTWNPTGRRVAFFPKKPVRDLLTDSHYWAAHISPYDVIHLNHDAFPELKWEDEPIEVELTIKDKSYDTRRKSKSL